MPKMELTAENVGELVARCLVNDAEKANGEGELMEGIVNSYHWHPGRVAEHAADIDSLLSQLPKSFHEKTGGGWSFLNACYREDGRQWTGYHVLMEGLCCLGVAAGKVEWCLPRDLWPALPGGMPYFIVKHDDDPQ